MHDYERALQLDPRMSGAALNRGIVHYQQGRHADATADLNKALELGADPATVYFNLALIVLTQGNHTAARADVLRALQHDRDHTGARELLDHLKASLPDLGR